METGKEIVFDYSTLSEEEYANATIASASVPVVFPYTELQGHKAIDSLSTGWNVNIISAINKCMTIVDSKSKIELDVIVMYPDRLPNRNGDFNTIANWWRRRALQNYYHLLSDIAIFMRANPDINYRYFVQATESPEPEYELLNFIPS